MKFLRLIFYARSLSSSPLKTQDTPGNRLHPNNFSAHKSARAPN
jgi:hypothetical protein